MLGPALARAAQSTLTRHLDDGDVRPLSLAAGRATQTRERRRGLRPVFRHSPMMAVVEPELAEEPLDEVTSEPTRAPRGTQSPRVVRGFDGSRAAAVVGAQSAPAPMARATDSRAAVAAQSTASGAVRPGAAPASRAASADRRAPAGSRVSGTRWLAERMRVGTSPDGTFRPAVMTRSSTFDSAAVSTPDGASAPRTVGSVAAASTVMRSGSLPKAGPRQASAHAASVFRRMQTGQVVPGSTLPVPVPRRARTGRGRALFMAAPEAIVPQAAAEQAVEEEAVAQPPRRRPTASPRVIRSSDQKASSLPSSGASASRTGVEVSRAPTPRTPSTGASSASVMDFGTAPQGARSPGRGPRKATTPMERVASRAAPTAAESPSEAGARSVAEQTPFGPVPTGTGVVPEGVPTSPRAAASSSVAPRARVASRTAVGSAGLATVHRAAEVAANRARPLERSRSLVPRRPRMAGEATAERSAFAPSMGDGRPVMSAAERMSRSARRAPGTRIADDAALVIAPDVEEEAEAVEAVSATRSREAAGPRVVRSDSRVQRLAAQVSTEGDSAGQKAASVNDSSSGTTSPAGGRFASDATVAFARSAKTLAASAATPKRISSVLHAAARAALEGKPDTVERLLRVADTAARREEAAASLLPKVAPRHGSRAPSMWSALRSPVDSAVSLAPSTSDESVDAGDAAAVSGAPRGSNTVPVVRSGSGTGGNRRASATVKAARRTVVSPITSGTARSVLRTAPPAVRARVKALLSRRSRPSALGYARLADVDDVLQAVTKAFSEAGGSPDVEVVRDVAGRRRLSSARKQAMANGSGATLSRPSDWAGARTASAVTDPDPRVRRAVSSMSVFRTAFGEMSVPAAFAAEGGSQDLASASGSRQGRHVLRTADGRFVSPTRGASSAPGSTSSAAARTGTRVARSAYGVDTDTVVSDDVGAADGSEGIAALGSTDAARGRSGASTSASQSRGASQRQGTRYRNRPGLQSTLGEVDEHSSARSELPVWARRASGSPLVRSSEQRDVMQALARAHTPEQVVQVMATHGSQLGSVPASLPAPVLKVIEQVREGARQDLEARYAAAQEASREAETGGARPASTPRKSTSAQPELLKAVRGLKKRQASRSQAGVGDDRVMKLARKLQSLIHLAEGTGDQNEARRHVRMAENSAAARAEGQGAVPGSNKESTKNKQVDIEALITEVVQSVNRELALRRERRQEDPDGGSWW